jgi:hypothetical protein
MKRYKVTLKHDNGIVKLYYFGNNEQEAREMTKRQEGCPESAILKLEIMPYYVVMTDKFMSGWGQAEGKINKYIIECQSYLDAEIVQRNAYKRPEMKYINISRNKPYYSPKGYVISMEKFENLGEIWKR